MQHLHLCYHKVLLIFYNIRFSFFIYYLSAIFIHKHNLSLHLEYDKLFISCIDKTFCFYTSATRPILLWCRRFLLIQKYFYISPVQLGGFYHTHPFDIQTKKRQEFLFLSFPVKSIFYIILFYHQLTLPNTQVLSNVNNNKSWFNVFSKRLFSTLSNANSACSKANCVILPT